jgi:hypothetical protein
MAQAAAIYVVVSDGCKSDGDSDPDQETWVDSDIAPTTDDDGDSTGQLGDESSTGAEDEELFAFWLADGIVMPGTSFVGGGELVVIDEADTEHCVLVWEFAEAVASTSCSDCEFAFDLTLGPIEIDVEREDGACDDWHELAMEGQLESLGYGVGTVYRSDGTSWTPVGDAEFVESSGEFFAEYELDD